MIIHLKKSDDNTMVCYVNNNIFFLPKTNYALEFCSQTTARPYRTIIFIVAFCLKLVVFLLSLEIRKFIILQITYSSWHLLGGVIENLECQKFVLESFSQSVNQLVRLWVRKSVIHFSLSQSLSKSLISVLTQSVCQ